MSMRLVKVLENQIELVKSHPQLKLEDVCILMDWVRKQPHFPQIEDPFLQALAGLYLHSCYYRIEPAKVAVDNTLTVRTLIEHNFNTPDDETIKVVLEKASYLVMMPKRTPEDYRVVMGKVRPNAVEHFVLANETKVLEQVIEIDYIQNGLSEGIVAVLDMKDFTLGHLLRFHLGVVKSFLYYIQEAAPIRIKGIHLVNLVPFVDKVVALVRPFMKKELYDMLILHSDSTMQSLYKYVPKECLPEEYGGELPPLRVLNDRSINDILENVEFFRWLDTKKVDESKRPGESKCAESFFGLDGTFKKLDID